MALHKKRYRNWTTFEHSLWRKGAREDGLLAAQDRGVDRLRAAAVMRTLLQRRGKLRLRTRDHPSQGFARLRVGHSFIAGYESDGHRAPSALSASSHEPSIARAPPASHGSWSSPRFPNVHEW